MDKMLYLKANVDRNSKVLRPLMRCLTPEEACELFDLDLCQPPVFREAVLEQVCIGMGEHLEDCHRELVENLFARSETLSPSKRITWGRILESLAFRCDHSMRQRITRLFLYSDRKDFRNRAYFIMKMSWDDDLMPDLVSVWLDRFEYNCTLVLFERAGAEFIKEHFETFYNLLGLGFMGKLFSSVPDVDSEMLTRLRGEDAITYAYVLATLKLTLTTDEAIQIYEENKADARLGILLWAFGQMKLWEALIHIDSETDCPD